MLKSIGTVATTLGIIQGTTWVILSLLTILTHLCVIVVTAPDTTEPTDTTAPTDGFIRTFTQLYVVSDTCETTKDETSSEAISEISQPGDIFIWACIYLIFSIFWLCISIWWLVDLSKKTMSPIIAYIWCSVTGSTLLLDFIGTIWFGIELGNMMDYVNKLAPSEIPHTEYLLSSALLMTMTAKGFTLYIVNAVLLVYIIIALLKKKKEQVPARRYSRQTSFINPTMNTAWPDHSAYQAPSIKEDVPHYSTYNPPMTPLSATYEYLPPIKLQDPPRGNSPAPQYTIPDPDYSPILDRAFPQGILPLRPALRKPPPGHIGRTVF